MTRWWWNLRFAVAVRLLPGIDKRVSVQIPALLEERDRA